MSEENGGFLSLEEKKKLARWTGPITVCGGQALIDKYEDSINSTSPPKPICLRTTSNKPIKGFYFKLTKELNDLLRFGFEGIYLAIGEYETGGHTLILYAVDSGGSTIELDDKIFDYSEPCPDKCPKRLMTSYCQNTNENVN